MSLSFPIGILGQVWYLIISIPDLCTLSFFTHTPKSILTLGLNDNEVRKTQVHIMGKII